MRVDIRKRGISPIIATVLLILMVVVSVSMLFVWARTFFDDRTEGSEKPVGELCSSVYFTVNVIYVDSKYKLEIINKGNIDITGFEIKKYLDGLTEIEKIETGVLSGQADTKEDIDLKMDSVKPERIEMFPILKESFSEKTFTCYSDPEYLII